MYVLNLGAPKGGKVMKKAIKLLTLAALFALPLAACNEGGNSGNNGNSGSNDPGRVDDGGGSGSGGSGGSGSGGGSQGGGQGGGQSGGGSGQQQSTTVKLDFNSLSSISGKVGGVSYEAKKAGGQNVPVVQDNGEYDNDMRIYAKGTFTLSASSNMTKAVFAISHKGLQRLADISVDSGSVSYGESTVTWTGNANKVTFTVGDKATHGSDGDKKAGQFCFYSVDITLGSGGGSGESGGGEDDETDADAFFKSILFAINGKEPVFNEDYWDYNGLYTVYDAKDLKDDVDNLYDLLKDDFDCEEPEEYDGDYGFCVYPSDEEAEYYVDIYSYEDDGNVVEIDLVDYSGMDLSSYFE